jgi:hypothetical protein
VNRTRDFSFAAKLGSVAGMVVVGVLMFGSQPGSATPAPPVGPTDIQPPILTPVPPLPPKPKPCEVIKCVPPTLEPCFQLPGHTCTPPTLDPCVIKPDDCKPPTLTPTKPPTLTPRPTKPTHPTTPTTQTDPPTGGIPTPNRIDTGEGPGPEGHSWQFWLAPGFGVFALGAGVIGLWWLRKSEGDHR